MTGGDLTEYVQCVPVSMPSNGEGEEEGEEGGWDEGEGCLARLC